MLRLTLLLAVGCAPSAESPSDSAPVDTSTSNEAPDDVTSPPAPEPQPGHIVCASEPTEGWPVTNDRLLVDLGTGAAELLRGPMFEVYGDLQPTVDEVLWEGIATVHDSGQQLSVTLPVGHIDLAGLDRFGTATLYGDEPTQLVCWHDSLPARVGIEPLPDAPSTWDAGCPEPLNDLPLPFVRATGVGRCARITDTLNGQDLSYPLLIDADLRGAHLAEASLYFASLVDARLEGTDLDGFEYGYAEITGSIDVDTRLPEHGCVASDDAVQCFR